jgi:hypothetical protein
LWIACTNQAMLNSRESSPSVARRAISTTQPLQVASNSARATSCGRARPGFWISTLSSRTRPSTTKRPSVHSTSAGNGVLASRFQSVANARAFELLGAAQDLGRAKRGLAVTVTNLCGVRGDVVEPQDQRQRVDVPFRDGAFRPCCFETHSHTTHYHFTSAISSADAESKT